MSLSVIIVEDNATSANIAARQLQFLGFDPQVAETGQDGWNLIHKVNPILVVIDERLPDMSGIDLIRSLREENPDLTVIMSTVVDDEKAIKRAFASGCNYYCIKPNGLKKLCSEHNSIDEMLNPNAQETYSK